MRFDRTQSPTRREQAGVRRGRSVGRIVGSATVAVLVAGAVAACGSSSSGGSAASSNGQAAKGIYGSVPSSSGSPVKGGTLTVFQLQGATPLYIMPITPAADASVYGTYFFDDQLYPFLYASAPSVTPSISYPLSIAKKPTFSDGGKTVTIDMNEDYKWSNGAPVDANDVIFYIDLTKAAVKKSAANFADYTPGLFPDNVVSATATGKYQLTLKLNKAYNPSFFLNDQLNVIQPMPSTDWNVDSANGPHLDYTNPANATKIYEYLNGLSSSIAKWQSTSLWQDVDGPFMLKTFSATNGGFTMAANPKYTGPDKPHIAALQGLTYTGITPLLNALKTGAVDIGTIDPSQLGQVGQVKAAGNSVFGYPSLAWTAAFINFKDKTDDFGNVIKQLYARQALAHLEDQPAYVSGVLKNAGGEAYGPVPSVPPTQFTPYNATHAPYPYSVSAAKKLLTSHGWKVVPGGVSTCVKPGTGAGECGAGIPAGTPFEFTWAYVTPTTIVMQSIESEAVASEAAKVGIKINLVSKGFDFLVQNYSVVSAPQYNNDWGVSYFGGYTDDIYPTQNSLFNTGGSYNQGGYSNSETDKLINASVYGSNPKAVTQEASQETEQIPVLFFPNPDLIYGVNKKVEAPSGAFISLTNYVFYPQLYWLKK
jgi:peptide/nickel transport system substrate-binding protein